MRLVTFVCRQVNDTKLVDICKEKLVHEFDAFSLVLMSENMSV